MRWPLRNQILVPMSLAMLSTIVSVSGATAYFAGERAKSAIEKQLRKIGQTLAQPRFPLTDGVLEQVKGLTGAEYALLDASGRLSAASGTLAERDLPPSTSAVTASQLRLGPTVRIGTADYFHSCLKLRDAGHAPAMLHIFYPEDQYRTAWRDAVRPPVLLGAGGMLLTIALAVLVASRAVRPLEALNQQVKRLASGDYSPVPLPERNDELRDLANAVNHAAEKLSRYESDIRHGERLRMLAQLSGGMAHQLRNAATGCRMALDIHAEECPLGNNCESFEVARRQLVLLEKYVQRFLTIGKSPPKSHRKRLEVGEFLDDLLPLVRPAAHHSGVELRWRRPDQGLFLEGDPTELEQLVLNLLLNAFEAAASAKAAGNRGWVALSCEPADDRIRIEVGDSGPGPSPDMESCLFEPFMSEKPEGIGLGLAVAREVARRHGGDITFERRSGATYFCVELPACESEPHRVETSGRG